MNISSPNFKSSRQDLQLQASRPARMGTTLDVGQVTETVNITSATIDGVDARRIESLPVQKQTMNLYSISPNVTNLQRRVAGILPIAIEVPRSGKAYRFVRPLVMEEETRITFQYKSK